MYLDLRFCGNNLKILIGFKSMSLKWDVGLENCLSFILIFFSSISLPTCNNVLNKTFRYSYIIYRRLIQLIIKLNMYRCFHPFYRNETQTHYKSVSYWCGIPVVVGVDTTRVIFTTTERLCAHDWCHFYERSEAAWTWLASFLWSLGGRVDTTGVISLIIGRPRGHDWRHFYDHWEAGWTRLPSFHDHLEAA